VLAADIGMQGFQGVLSKLAQGAVQELSEVEMTARLVLRCEPMETDRRALRSA
jgi:hypothetical protein